MDRLTFKIVVIIDPNISPEIGKQAVAFLEILLWLPPSQSQIGQGKNSGHSLRVF